MPIYLSLLALVLGVSATGFAGSAWWNYGEVTPAALLYITQDMTQPSLTGTEPVRTTETLLTPPAGTIAPAEPIAPMAPMPPAATEGGFGEGTSVMPPPERPIMPPPPDQPGARDYSGQPPPIQPMPSREKIPLRDQQNDRQDQPRQPMPQGNGRGNEMPPPQEQEFDDEEQPEPQIDPREIRQTLRDITQMQRELKRFLKTLKKYKADTSEVDQLLEAIDRYRIAISGSDMEAVRDAVHEFRDENYWETIQIIRAKVELPSQLARTKKELTKLEKTLKSSVYQKLGVNVGGVNAYISDSRARISQMESLLNSGDFDELNSFMQENQDTPMPGELLEVLSRLKEVDSRLKRVRDAGAKAKIQEILSGVIQLVNEGEYREARDLMNQNTQQIQQIANPSSNNRNAGNRMAPGTR